MPRLTLDDDYWSLVHLLMIHGWYRAGQGPADDFERTQWGFRAGHLRDVPSSPPLWIAARDECTAMRILLREVKSALANRASRVTCAANASLSDPGIPGAGRVGPSQDFALP
jgi:hypothetical protein